MRRKDAPGRFERCVIASSTHPTLNSLFHAFDALGHRIGHKFWKDGRDGLPLGYKGGFQFVPDREIAPSSSDETAALILIGSVISKNAEGGIRNGEWGSRKGGWQMPDGE